MEPRERYKYDRFVQGLMEQVGYGVEQLRLKNNLLKFRLEMQVKEGREIDQIEFANLLGINKDQYNRYERQKAQPSLPIAWNIAKKLGKKIEDLFEEEEREE